MLHPLFDHFLSVSVILIVTVVVLFLRWRRTEDRRYGQGMIAIITFLAVFGIARLFWETPTEQIKRKTEEMIAAVNRRDINGVFQHVSEDFRHGDLNKAMLRTFTEHHLQQERATEVRAGSTPRVDFRRPAVAGRSAALISFYFTAKVEGMEMQMRFEGTYVRDPDGQWRLQNFDVFYPPTSTTPLPFP